MATVTKEPGMGKKRGRPRRSERDDVAIKIDRKLATMAKVIAAQQGISVAELASSLLEGPMKKAYMQMIENLKGE